MQYSEFTPEKANKGVSARVMARVGSISVRQYPFDTRFLLWTFFSLTPINLGGIKKPLLLIPSSGRANPWQLCEAETEMGWISEVALEVIDASGNNHRTHFSSTML